MFIAKSIVSVNSLLSMDEITYLIVPTPPATEPLAQPELRMTDNKPSSINDTPSDNSLPIHRIANARKIWPCATRSTSQTGASPFGLPMALSWKRVRMSLTTLSRRLATSAGDLSPRSLVRPSSSYNALTHTAVMTETHSPPGQPSLQISQIFSPRSSLCCFICALVRPS